MNKKDSQADDPAKGDALNRATIPISLADDTRATQKGAEADSQNGDAHLPFAEFITLVALLMSLVALSIDAILPALQDLGQDLGNSQPQRLQQVVTVLLAGLAIGQLLYGPLSDQIGRKRAIYLGLALFLFGSWLSWSSTSFSNLLIGRFLQGFGAAGPRIVIVALVRDLYAGRAMARIMSIAMGIFILVPVIAPIMGQAVAQLAGWRAVFVSFMLLGASGGLWLALRQPETLLPENRIRITPKALTFGLGTVFSTPSCLGYMLASGIVSGPFIYYLSVGQDLFKTTYGVGDLFPYYFGACALFIGLATFVNARLVLKFGMRLLLRSALVAMIALSALALMLTHSMQFVPPIWLFLALIAPLFFCIGILFGNLSALAMEDVGQVAGLASAVVGAVSTFIATAIAFLMGQMYHGTILTLACGFALCGLCALVIAEITEKRRQARATGKSH